MFLKSIRTIKLISPRVNELKFRAQFFLRSLFRRPHENHFRIMSAIDDRFFIDKCLVDVGANRGQTIQSFRLYSDAPVFSFEPQENLAEYIKNRRLHNSFILPYGLGRMLGSMEIFIPVYRGIVFDGLASTSKKEAEIFFRPDRFFFYDKSKLEIRQQTIEIKTLDSFALKPAVLKIDVQGAELSVLKGALKTIIDHQPIIFLERPSEYSEIKFLKELNYDGYILKGRKLIRSDFGYNVIFLRKGHFSWITKNLQLELK